MGWQTQPDTQVVTAATPVQVTVETSCYFGTGINPDTLSAALANDTTGKIGSVSGVTEAWSNFLTPNGQTLYAVVFPAMDGEVCGDLRNAVTQALVNINQQKTVPCSGFTVTQVATESTGSLLGGILGLPSGGPSPSTTISLISVAVIGIVLLVMFNTLKGSGVHA